MLLITLSDLSADTATLRLEGEVIGPWVEELRTVCERKMTPRSAVLLDLAEVTFIDRHGIALLKTLEGRGVRLCNCSGFVAEQLRH